MHYDLIVYKNSYDLLLLLYNLSFNFSKEYKYSLGEKIKDEALELLVDICRANNCFENRLANIKIALNRIEKITIYTRILKDLKQINLKKFAFLSEKIEVINRQLISWRNKS
ncbi:MAG: four helix bundle protein [Patescibacteria group bacterium]|nr:four helix bundle protein [Patescibacteria group bacterium]